MTQVEQVPAEDRGRVFFLVRAFWPPNEVIEKMPRKWKELVRSNLVRAQRHFRSKTLPYLGSPARLITSLDLEFWSLSDEINLELERGISDKAILSRLATYGGDTRSRAATVELVTKQIDGGEIPEMLWAKELLGKHWYRYQEWDIYDAIEFGRNLMDARERGETGTNVLMGEKPPLPPRR